MYHECRWVGYIWNVKLYRFHKYENLENSIWTKYDKVFEYAFVFGYKELQYKFIMAFDNQKLELRKFYSMELE